MCLSRAILGPKQVNLLEQTATYAVPGVFIDTVTEVRVNMRTQRGIGGEIAQRHKINQANAALTQHRVVTRPGLIHGRG